MPGLARARSDAQSSPGSRGNARGPGWGTGAAPPSRRPVCSVWCKYMPFSTVAVWMRVGKSRLGKKLYFKIKNPSELDGEKKKKQKKSGRLEETPGPSAHWGPRPCVRRATAPPHMPLAQVTVLTFAEAGLRRAGPSPGKVT